MSTQDFKRKLTAVFSADAAGYSRLMGENEEATVKTLEAYKQVMFSLVKQHRGRVVDAPGDNVLAEFASVVDAVQCGVAVQKELLSRNADLTENRKMRFRIGINLGDVIEEGGRIYGDGVNIAARLESLADPGGICISKTAFDQIETKLPLGYEYLGDQTVKNIARPVAAYRVLMEPRVVAAGAREKEPSAHLWEQRGVVAGAIAVLVVIMGFTLWTFTWRAPKIEPASVTKTVHPLPDKPPPPPLDKPSIAVLPFANMSDDPKQGFFADGLTEEIITALSKTPKLFVIARNSSFVYKGKPVNVQQVSRELGVRHVLEGSVRRSGDQVRITAQLIEAPAGNHLWSERYERSMGEIFAVQDEITLAIVRALRVTLTSGEQARLIGKGTKNLEAYLNAIAANEQFYLMNRQGSLRAKEFAREAISLDPKYAFPYAILANAHMLDAWMRFGESYEESMKVANDAAHKALDLDDSDPYIHSVLTNLYVMQRRYDEAAVSAERALALGPGAARSQSSMGTALAFSCRFHEAIPFFEEAIRLDPYPPSPVFRLLGGAYSAVGRHDEALKAFENALKLNPDDIFAHMSLAAEYVELGREEQAHAQVREVLRLHPKFSLEHFAKTLTFRDPSYVHRRLELLQKAGLR
jgi:adenylate cyclase